jgi:hypothetical protein
MPKGKNTLTEQIVVRVTKDLKKSYEKAAKAKNCGLSEVLRPILEDNRPITEERQRAA